MIPIAEAGGIRYGVCDASDFEEMVHLLGEAFSLHDPPAVALGITAAEFAVFVRLFGATAAIDGLTIVARAADTRALAGALFTEDAAAPPPADLSRLSRKFDPINDLLDLLEADYRRGSTLRPGDCLHLFLLGVARSFGGRGVAQQLVTTCLEHGRRSGYGLAVTEATNSVSQHIFRRLGFVERARRSYRDYRFEGKAPFAGIEGHVGPMLMDRSIGP